MNKWFDAPDWDDVKPIDIITKAEGIYWNALETYWTHELCGCEMPYAIFTNSSTKTWQNQLMNPHNFEQMSEPSVLSQYPLVKENVGLKRIRFQVLWRHPITPVIQQKTHPKYIQEQLGHGSINVTMDSYGRLFEGDHRYFVSCLHSPVDSQSATQPQLPLGITHVVRL